VRLPFNTFSNGTVYFSFILRIDQIGSFTGHDTFAGLALDTVTTYYPKIDAVCNSSNAYQLGIYKGSGTTYGAIAPNVFTTNDMVFIVARYTFNTNSTTDDTCDLWLNPDPATFGAGESPSPNIALIGGAANDAVGVDRFTWRGTTSGAQKKTVDELRIGRTWAEVTSLPPVHLAIARNGGNAILFWPTNGSAGFVLESNSNLNDSGGWAPVTPVIMQGTNNTATVSTSAGEQYFRLKK
jgi:hypothetical protein